MRILAIDTTMETCSVALWNNGNYFTRLKKCPRQHTKYILSLIKDILLQGNTNLADLDALAFNRGPGNFTGIRICIGTAQGLALGANLPMIGISALEIMAQSAFLQTGMTRILVAIDTNIGEIYWAEYIRNKQGIWYNEKSEAQYNPELINMRLNELSGKWAIVGTGWETQLKMVKEKNHLTLTDSIIIQPTAKEMLPIACQLLANGKTIAVERAEPIYLRNEMWKKFLDRKTILVKRNKKENSRKRSN